MLPTNLKKEMMGYDKKEVEKLFEQQDEQIEKLRSELDESTAMWETLKTELGKKDELIHSLQQKAAAAKETADESETASKLREQEERINELTTENEGLRGMIMSLQSRQSANFNIIERMYAHALDSSKLFVGDARLNIEAVVERTYRELAGDIDSVKVLFRRIGESRSSIDALLCEAKSHIIAIEELFGTFADESPKLDIFAERLKQTKNEIYTQIEKSVEHYDNITLEDYSNGAPFLPTSTLAVGAPAVGAPAAGTPIVDTHTEDVPAVSTPAVSTPVENIPVENIPDPAPAPEPTPAPAPKVGEPSQTSTKIDIKQIMEKYSKPE